MNPEIDEKELARCAIQLLQRASLTGAEVGAYVTVVRWLEDVARGGPPLADGMVQS